MTSQRAFAYASYGFAVLFAPWASVRLAHADDALPDAGRWSPGHDTTSKLQGEVSADRRSPGADGVYGRLDGDLTLGFGAGAELTDGSARGLFDVTAHYYWTAGIYAAYRERLGDAGPDRIASVGVDLRPSFIPRWSLGWQSGPATLDLLLDSVSLSAGAFFSKGPSLDHDAQRGFETSLGAGVPLSARAPGLWLSARYTLDWYEARHADPSVWLFISWQVLVNTPLVANTAQVH